MDMNPVGWFEIYVDDLDRAVKFYQDVLKVNLEELPSPVPEADTDASFKMMAFPMKPDATGATGALIKMEGMSAGGNGVMVYFNCQDCAVEAARVDTAGGKLMKPKMSIGPYGFIAIASDSEGNMFGLHSRA